MSINKKLIGKNMFKKVITSIALSALISSAIAKDTCGVVIDVAPGGIADRYARLLQKYNPNFNVFFKPGGLGIPAVNHLRDNPTHIYLSTPALFGDKSPLPNPPLELHKIVLAAPIMAVTNKPNVDLNFILTGKANVGIPAVNTAHDLIAEQLKLLNPNIQIIPTGGNSRALPLIMTGELDVFIVSAGDGIGWINQFKTVKEIFKISLGNTLKVKDAEILNVGFNGAMLYKNATPEQKEFAKECLAKAITNDNWFEDMKELHANPVRLSEKERDNLLSQYIGLLRKFNR